MAPFVDENPADDSSVSTTMSEGSLDGGEEIDPIRAWTEIFARGIDAHRRAFRPQIVIATRRGPNVWGFSEGEDDDLPALVPHVNSHEDIDGVADRLSRIGIDELEMSNENDFVIANNNVAVAGGEGSFRNWVDEQTFAVEPRFVPRGTIVWGYSDGMITRTRVDHYIDDSIVAVERQAATMPLYEIGPNRDDLMHSALIMVFFWLNEVHEDLGSYCLSLARDTSVIDTLRFLHELIGSQSRGGAGKHHE